MNEIELYFVTIFHFLIPLPDLLVAGKGHIYNEDMYPQHRLNQAELPLMAIVSALPLFLAKIRSQ